jgi:hypothetical protein
MLDDGWRYVGRHSFKGYEWRGRGAVRKIVFRPGRLDVRGEGTNLVQTLFTDPGAVQVVLQLGSRQWCLEFGGTFDVRSARKLRAHDAPAPLGCVQP